MAKKKSPKMLKIRQTRGTPGTKHAHREVLRGLGLRRPNHVVEREDTPSVRGMVNKVAYMVEIVEDTETTEEAR